MDVTWLGHGCFRLRGRNATAITDPYPNSIGLRLGRLEGQLVTISHPHENHSYLAAMRDESAMILDGPGEYEVAGVPVIGVATFHDNQGGAELGRNTVFVLELDDVRVCHLGDLGHTLTSEQVELLGTVDVLLVPVGGGTTLDATRAAEVVRQIEPRVVVPMHYATPGLARELEGVDRFLREMGITEAPPQPKLTLQAVAGEPETTRVVVLEPRNG